MKLPDSNLDSFVLEGACGRPDLHRHGAELSRAVPTGTQVRRVYYFRHYRRAEMSLIATPISFSHWVTPSRGLPTAPLAIRMQPGFDRRDQSRKLCPAVSSVGTGRPAYHHAVPPRHGTLCTRLSFERADWMLIRAFFGSGPSGRRAPMKLTISLVGTGARFASRALRARSTYDEPDRARRLPRERDSIAPFAIWAAWAFESCLSRKRNTRHSGRFFSFSSKLANASSRAWISSAILFAMGMTSWGNVYESHANARGLTVK
jgi:hypothetical protein